MFSPSLIPRSALLCFLLFTSSPGAAANTTTTNDTIVRCTPLVSQFCPFYNNISLPFQISSRFDFNFIESITKQSECTGSATSEQYFMTNNKNIAIMNCYSMVIAAQPSCSANTNIKRPCKATCKEMYKKFQHRCFGWLDIEHNLCDDYPENDCLNGASTKISGSTLLLLLVAMAMTWGCLYLKNHNTNEEVYFSHCVNQCC